MRIKQRGSEKDMHPNHFQRLLLRFSILCFMMLSGTFPAASQTNVQPYLGRWIWKEPAKRNKPQTQFSIVIQRQGKTIKGTYSVNEFINGEWQGEDGNQTPFIGQLQGNELQLEFDPMATVPGYEENVKYVPPSDGRKPSKAVLERRGTTLRWRLSTGPGIEGVPESVVLVREGRTTVWFLNNRTLTSTP